ncbi:Uncharacterised protein [Megamonas hypermegale]|uniref:Uncharacterized protein n=2 Tax=Megamonas hypermegale TaxID=158847 RepID=A0A239TMT4_9FIRM|nr:hypothetical protein [Megamonas hypermegale]SNU99157.1 Uncharacterised protein [Megamonas hypermegale]
MYNNLILEMVKKGYKLKDIPCVLANSLDCSKKIIKNKLQNTEEFTFLEAIKINEQIFNNEMNLKYLFSNKHSSRTTYYNSVADKNLNLFSKWWI